MTIADWAAKMEIDQKQKQTGGSLGEILVHRRIRSTLLEGIATERIRTWPEEGCTDDASVDGG